MEWFQSLHIETRDKMKRLKATRLIPNNSWKLETEYWVFDLTSEVSQRILMVLNNNIYGDCHYFAFIMSTWIIPDITWVWLIKRLWWYWLKPVWSLSFREEKISIEKRNLERKKFNLETPSGANIVCWVRNEEDRLAMLNDIKQRLIELNSVENLEILDNPYYCAMKFSIWDNLVLWDMLYKAESDHHSMIFLWYNQVYGPIFISRIWDWWELSIHTLWQITEKFYDGEYEIYRKITWNELINEESIVKKIRLAKWDFFKI